MRSFTVAFAPPTISAPTHASFVPLGVKSVWIFVLLIAARLNDISFIKWRCLRFLFIFLFCIFLFFSCNSAGPAINYAIR